jgi:hypothetical protein
MPSNRPKPNVRGEAVAAAVLLLLAGGVSGVLVDRLFLLPRDAEEMPLTSQAMAARLDLSPAEEARMRALLDSMHAEVTAAAQLGPDSLAVTARRVHVRVEAALPPGARPAFRAWMHEHHRQLMRRMGSGRDDHRGRHP